MARELLEVGMLNRTTRYEASRYAQGAFLHAYFLRERHVFHVRETINRGPLLLHAARARMLQFFDFELYPFENSDHDLACRAAQLGWAVGFYAIDTTWGGGLEVDEASGRKVRIHRTRDDTQNRSSTEGWLNLSHFAWRKKQIHAGTYAGFSTPQPRRGCLFANLDAIVASPVRAEERVVVPDIEALTRRLREVGCAGRQSPNELASATQHGVCYNHTDGEQEAVVVPWGWAGSFHSPGHHPKLPLNASGMWYRTASDGVLACATSGR